MVAFDATELPSSWPVPAEPPVAPGGPAADNEKEWLDVVNEKNEVVGKELRGKCHKEGILHRAVHVFLFRKDGSLLIQRRSARKKLAPTCWDLSAAEHLSVGESYLEAARRGLQEELGVSVDLASIEVLDEPHERRLQVPEIGVDDHEMVQAVAVRGYEGDVTPDFVEVSEVRWVDPRCVWADMAGEPDSYTEWFRGQAMRLGWRSSATAELY
ncbi:unnamed protein product [Pedinophyceae sp. YPF-701]|nr:unnamed protein product [Pedinophyceae sp. YPF-701]